MAYLFFSGASKQRLSCRVVGFTGNIQSVEVSLNGSIGLLLLGKQYVQQQGGIRCKGSVVEGSRKQSSLKDRTGRRM